MRRNPMTPRRARKVRKPKVELVTAAAEGGEVSLRERVWKADEEACMFLGITPDQLKIARALDREKVRVICRILADGATGDPIQECPEDFQTALDWLPTFDKDPANAQG